MEKSTHSGGRVKVGGGPVGLSVPEGFPVKLNGGNGRGVGVSSARLTGAAFNRLQVESLDTHLSSFCDLAYPAESRPERRIVLKCMVIIFCMAQEKIEKKSYRASDPACFDKE